MSAKPLGRRPGPESSRGDIVAAARSEFAQRGFERATMRSIAARADVDPATIYRFFANKDELLAAALEFPVSDDMVEMALGGSDPLSPSAFLTTLLGLWQSPDVAERLIALIRVAATHEQAGAIVSDLVERTVLTPLVARIDGDDAELRAALVATQLAGLALTRLLIPIEPVAGASIDDLVASIAPTIERYLTGDLFGP